MIQLDPCLFYQHGFVKGADFTCVYNCWSFDHWCYVVDFDAFSREFTFDSAETCVSKLWSLSCIAACYCVFLVSC